MRKCVVDLVEAAIEEARLLCVGYWFVFVGEDSELNCDSLFVL